MNRDSSLMRDIIHQVSLGMDAQIKAQAEAMGEISEKIPPAEQMAAWKDMQGNIDRWIELADRVGPQEAIRWAKEMRRREKLSG